MGVGKGRDRYDMLSDLDLVYIHYITDSQSMNNQANNIYKTKTIY